MTVEIMSMAVPCEGGGYMREFYVRSYETVEKDGSARDESVRDANHARAILGELCFSDGVRGFGFKDGTPPSGSIRIMSVYVIVTDTRRGVTHYTVAYKRHDQRGSFTRCAEEMVEAVYRPIKRILRKSRRAAK